MQQKTGFINGDDKLVYCNIEHKQEENIRERLKELTCLYKVSLLINKPDITREKLCSGIAAAINEALLYPERSAVVIEIEDHRCQCSAVIDSNGSRLESDILIRDKKSGRIEVCNIPGNEFFLPFEQHLINSIANMLSLWLQRQFSEESLRRERELFHAILFSIEEGIIAADDAGKIIVMNKLAEEYWLGEGRSVWRNLSKGI